VNFSAHSANCFYGLRFTVKLYTAGSEGGVNITWWYGFRFLKWVVSDNAYGLKRSVVTSLRGP
jgi:hypothetical protein